MNWPPSVVKQKPRKLWLFRGFRRYRGREDAPRLIEIALIEQGAGARPPAEDVIGSLTVTLCGQLLSHTLAIDCGT